MVEPPSVEDSVVCDPGVVPSVDDGVVPGSGLIEFSGGWEGGDPPSPVWQFLAGYTDSG